MSVAMHWVEEVVLKYIISLSDDLMHAIQLMNVSLAYDRRGFIGNRVSTMSYKPLRLSLEDLSFWSGNRAFSIRGVSIVMCCFYSSFIIYLYSDEYDINNICYPCMLLLYNIYVGILVNLILSWRILMYFKVMMMI